MARRGVVGKKQRATLHIHLILIIAIALTLFPVVWILLTSFKPSLLMTESKPLCIFRPTLEHYQSLLALEGDFDLFHQIINSFIITVTAREEIVMIGSSRIEAPPRGAL